MRGAHPGPLPLGSLYKCSLQRQYLHFYTSKANKLITHEFEVIEHGFATRQHLRCALRVAQVLSLLALIVQKYKY